MRILVAVLLVLSLLVPAAGALVGCSEGQAGSGSTTAEATTVTLDVDGMTCESCESAIKAAVEKLPGVRSCLASHSEKLARVELEPGASTGAEQLAATIRGLGYEVTLR